MQAENWGKIEAVFHQALSLKGETREKYLQETCLDDFVFLNEIKSLITSYENEAEFLESPALELGLKIIHQQAEETRSKTRLGCYEIGEKIGSGGMGEVYEALDTKLNRKVALKFLSSSLKDDNVAKRQLRKEAQAVAMLDHPNICAVYGIEEIDDDNFIVMQFIEGITLENKLKTCSVDHKEFKLLAKQIISAVAFAHSHGIIHRDLKPGNIMISGEGQIKVLDFGLAKILGEQKKIGNDNSTNSSHFSTNGLVIGTVAYMSPDQLRGEKLDYQSDIFSLGIILYELLAKENPFQRNSQAETIAAILTDESISAERITPRISRNVTKLIDRCLEKDKNRRCQSAAEVLVELDKIESEKSGDNGLKNHLGFFLRVGLAVVLIMSVFSAIFFYTGKSSPKTIAVLPISFDNPPAGKEYLADGLTKTIIDKLSILADLKVKKESSVLRYKGKKIEPQTTGKELNADAVVVGSIIKRGDELFLSTNIIRTSDGVFLDSNEAKIEEANLLDLPESVAGRILNKISSKINSLDKTKLAGKETESTEAVNNYLKGRFLLKTQKNADDVEKAIRLFTDAKDLDPQYAKPWAGLADAYLLQTTPGVKSAVSPERAIQSAKLAAKKALELDNTLSESYTSLGLISLKYEWNWSEAENYFRTAVNFDSESLSPQLGLINVLRIQKRFDEALSEVQKVREIDPVSIAYELQTALIYYRKYDFAEADRILTDLQQRFPEERTIKYIHSYVYLKTKRFKEAIEILEQMYNSANGEARVYPAAPLGFGYAKIGRRNDALKVIEELDHFGKNSYVPSQEKALIYLGLRDYDKVFEFLDKSCQEKFSALPGWVTDPIVDEVWTDPRITRIKQCVNL